MTIVSRFLHLDSAVTRSINHMFTARSEGISPQGRTELPKRVHVDSLSVNVNRLRSLSNYFEDQ